jgi:Mg-chelatase subunit ChlD
MFPDEHTEIDQIEKIESFSGKLSMQFVEDKLMHSILRGDKKKLEHAKLIEESINNSIGGFTPDLMMQQLVQNYHNAKKLYGETILRLLSSYSPDYIEKNLGIPEFQRELRQKLEKNIEALKHEKLLNADGSISEKGEELASLIMYCEELDCIVPKGISGGWIHKKRNVYGSKEDFKEFKKGDRYADLAVKHSVTRAIRRGHKDINERDLVSFERKSKGNVYIVYGLDASSSMKGKKIEAAKKAGIALAYKAISEKDKVGLLVFESEVKDSVAPTTDFSLLLKKIASVRASRQTDFKLMIKNAVDIFPNIAGITKHLVMLTDAMPTVGDNPERDALDSVADARGAGITISIMGVGLEKKGEELAKKITEISGGRFYVVKSLELLDKIILEDYYEYI